MAPAFQIWEKLLDYSFTVTWVQGKTHYIADALSRYPVFGPHEMELPVDDSVNKLLSLSDITTMVDTDYNYLVSFVKGNQCFSKLSDNHVAKLFHSVMDDLSVRIVDNTELVILQGMRIVVPFPTRKLVMRDLHHAHSGLTKTPLKA